MQLFSIMKNTCIQFFGDLDAYVYCLYREMLLTIKEASNVYTVRSSTSIQFYISLLQHTDVW
jgi:hypothetical protein